MKLLFRASQYGFLAAKFHELCDGKPNTFTLIKTEFGKTIAGFTPVEWELSKDGKFKSDVSKRSFLLSLDLHEKMPMSNEDNIAIYCRNIHGPNFGWYS